MPRVLSNPGAAGGRSMLTRHYLLGTLEDLTSSKSNCMLEPSEKTMHGGCSDMMLQNSLPSSFSLAPDASCVVAAWGRRRIVCGAASKPRARAWR